MPSGLSDSSIFSNTSCSARSCSSVQALRLPHPLQHLLPSMTCGSAPQHQRQDVVLPPSLPCPPRPHLASLASAGLLHVLLPSTPWTRAICSDCATLLCTAQIPTRPVVACSSGFHQTSSIDTIHPVVALCDSDTFHLTVICVRFICS